MGFIQDKENIIAELGINKTIIDLPKLPPGGKTSSIDSVKDKKKNILPFLLETLGMTKEENNESNEKGKKIKKKKKSLSKVDKGNFNLPKKPNIGNLKSAVPRTINNSGMPDILKEVLTTFYPRLINIVKDAILVGTKESIVCGSNFTLPQNNSIFLDLQTVDFSSMLKSDPDSSLSSFMYGEPSKDFNRFLYNTIQTPGNVETWSGPNGDLLDLQFIAPAQINLQINSNYNNKTYNEFSRDFVDSLEIFDKKNFMANMLNTVFGNLDAELGKSLDELTDEQLSNKMLDNILNTDPCEDDIVFDNSFFSFSNDEIFEIENAARQRKNGINDLDVGCGIVSTTNTTINGLVLTDLSNDIEITKNIDNILKSVGTQIATEVGPENSESAQKKIMEDLITSIPKTIMNMTILTPKVMCFYQLSNSMVNGASSLNNLPTKSSEFIKSNPIFFEYIGREALAALTEIVFKILKREIIKLIQKQALIIIAKAIKKIKEIIVSYTIKKAGVKDGTMEKLPAPKVTNNV